MLPGVSGRTARGEVPEEKVPEDKAGGNCLANAKTAGCSRPKPTGVSEAKGNSSSSIHVDRVGIVGWAEKSLSAVKAVYGKTKLEEQADKHQEM